MPTRVNNAKVVRALSPSDKSVSRNYADPLCNSILDAIADGISIHSLSGEITWANRELCTLYGRTLTELIGLSCSNAFHADDARCLHEQVLETGCGLEMIDLVRISDRSLSVAIEPVFDGEKELCGFIRVMRDVTSQRRALEQLLKAERFATLGQLISGVLHDAGTPLNVISGYSEYLLMGRKPEDRGYKELSAIIDQTRRIAAMFGQALDLARPAQGRRDPIDIQSLIADSLALVGYHLRTAGVTASLTCRIDKPLIYGEASQLRLAVFNLLVNAGQSIGLSGRLQVVVDEAKDNAGFVGLALLGTEATGSAHDFSRSFAALFGRNVEREAGGIGLFLTGRILAEAGANVLVTEASGQAGGLLIYLPVNAGSRRSD